MEKELKVVSDRYELSPEVERLLHEISERRDNYRPKDPDSYYHAEGMILKEQIVKLHNKDTMYLDDLKALRKIDSMKIPSSDKILTYFYYIPSLVTLEEAGEILEAYKELEGIENPYRVSFYYSTLIINRLKWDILTLRGLSDHLRDEREYLYLFDSLYYRPEDKETVDLLYKLNKFLEEAGAEESYNDFYEGSDETVFGDDGLPDLSKFLEYTHTSTLLKTFIESFVGAMGEGVNKGVTEKLKTVSKEDYLKVLDMNKLIKGETLMVVEELLEKVRNPVDVIRPLRENLNIFYSILMKKAVESRRFDFVQFMPVITKEFEYKDWLDNPSVHSNLLEDETILTNIFLENKKDLSIAQLVAVKYAFENPVIWVRTGSTDARKSLFFRLFRGSPVGMAKMMEYMVFEYDKQAPTMTQWKNTVDEGTGLFDLSPPLTMDLINDDADVVIATINIFQLRKYYDEGLFT